MHQIPSSCLHNKENKQFCCPDADTRKGYDQDTSLLVYRLQESHLQLNAVLLISFQDTVFFE